MLLGINTIPLNILISVHSVLMLEQVSYSVEKTLLTNILPGALLIYFNDGRVQVIFLDLKFWPK